MAEGTIAAASFLPLETEVVIGLQTGPGLFQAMFDILTTLIDFTDPQNPVPYDATDEIEFICTKQLLSGGGQKSYAHEIVTSADIMAQLEQGVALPDLDFYPPAMVPTGYQTQITVKWLAGTPKDLPWEYLNSIGL